MTGDHNLAAACKKHSAGRRLESAEQLARLAVPHPHGPKLGQIDRASEGCESAPILTESHIADPAGHVPRGVDVTSLLSPQLCSGAGIEHADHSVDGGGGNTFPIRTEQDRSTSQPPRIRRIPWVEIQVTEGLARCPVPHDYPTLRTGRRDPASRINVSSSGGWQGKQHPGLGQGAVECLDRFAQRFSLHCLECQQHAQLRVDG